MLLLLLLLLPAQTLVNLSDLLAPFFQKFDNITTGVICSGDPSVILHASDLLLPSRNSGKKKKALAARAKCSEHHDLSPIVLYQGLSVGWVSCPGTWPARSGRSIGAATSPNSASSSCRCFLRRWLLFRE
jgi:hypothetical protein